MKLGRKTNISDLPTGFFLPTRITGNNFLLKGGLRPGQMQETRRKKTEGGRVGGAKGYL